MGNLSKRQRESGLLSRVGDEFEQTIFAVNCCSGTGQRVRKMDE